MSNLSPTKINRSNDRPKVLIWGLLLSLLLHILVVLFFVFFPQQQDLKLKRPPTTVVRLIDLPTKTKKPQPEKKSVFEIDQKPVETPPTTPVKSFRKAEQDQKVKKEQAPEADDARDQTTKRPVTILPQQQRPQPEVHPVQPQEKAPAEKEKTEQPDKPVKSIHKAKTEPTVKQDKVKEKTQPIKTKPAVPATPPLSVEQLLPNSSTLDRITQGTQADRNRRKKREGVEIGDEVWLDLQQNWLASFFRRLHDKIDLVWNYPSRAVRNRIEGTVGLTIVINKKGELLDVILDRSSGSDLLDSEAMQAIYRAAPFGPITKRYPHEVLKIHANFRYQIGGRSIFGR
ncbi:MAG: TonB family protein [Desulfuromusa sp.]|nr:TonB family protein [Desulfuromusa sp.]